MGLLSWLFGRKNKKGNAGDHDALMYDKTLVGQLKADHQELVAIFTDIKNAASGGQYARVPGLLNDFKIALQAHVMKENVEFYVYVQALSSNDPVQAEFVSKVRKEMNGIANAVAGFVKKYSGGQLTQASASTFLTELGEVGAALLKRVELEENELYALYLPS